MQKILRTNINKIKNSQDFFNVIFVMNGKKQMWFQSIKKVVKCQETTDLFHYFQYVEKYLSFYYNINDLISSNQSVFKQGDSCIYQLLSITHEIYQSLDNGFELRGIFLDISKGFDKVWHNGLIFKLKQNGLTGDLLNILINFLKERKQRVVINGQHSKWSNISAGVSQESILGPFHFLIYINDLFNNLSPNLKLFADDTSLFSVVHDMKQSGINLNDDLEKITNWAFQWKMSFNPK